MEEIQKELMIEGTYSIVFTLIPNFYIVSKLSYYILV